MSPTLTGLEPAWAANWVWGLALIALTLALHAFGIALIAHALVRLDGRLRRRSSLPRPIMFSTALIGAVGLVLASLHGVEAAIWAWAYLWLGAVSSMSDAMLYSVDSITTRGASGLALNAHWRMMGALESANGMLLFGTSTAFLFAIMERIGRVVAQAAKGSARTTGS
jgi:hypothetical protein